MCPRTWLLAPALFLIFAFSNGCENVSDGGGKQQSNIRQGSCDVPGPDACVFGKSFPTVEGSADYEFSDERTLAAEGDFSSQQSSQLLRGMSTFGAPETVAAALAATDDGKFVVRTMVGLELDTDAFTVFQFKQRGRSMGFVFTMESLELIALVHDDAIVECVLLTPPDCDAVQAELDECIEAGHAMGCTDIVGYDRLDICELAPT